MAKEKRELTNYALLSGNPQAVALRKVFNAKWKTAKVINASMTLLEEFDAMLKKFDSRQNAVLDAHGEKIEGDEQGNKQIASDHPEMIALFEMTTAIKAPKIVVTEKEFEEANTNLSPADIFNIKQFFEVKEK